MASVCMQAQLNQCARSKQNTGHHNAVASVALTDKENQYDLKFYHLNVNVERTNKNISGWVSCIATVKATTLDSFAFELHNAHTIDSVIVQGIKMPFSRSGDEARAALPTPLSQNTQFVTRVYYHGTCPTNNGAAIGDGFNNASSPSWGNQATWSLSESYSAYEWFPCKQQLQDKLDSSWVWITTDSTNKAGSNGLLKNIANAGNGKKRYEWYNGRPIDYYLISVSVAKYIDYSFYAKLNATDSVLIQNYIYDNPATLTKFKPVIDSTAQFIKLFSTLYGKYPWASQKYGHCMAPLSGGMEHQTMTTLGFFDFATTAHELAHQWFGDKATCRTWHDIFMNEGFAAYSEHLASEFLEPTTAFAQMTAVHNRIMQQPNGSVYNPDTTDVNRIFDSRLSYDKGSAVIHSLRFVINSDSIFFLSLRNYLAQYNNSTASIDDFKNSVATTTGINLNQFFTQWIYGEGYPKFGVHWNQQGSQFTMRSIQTVSDASVTPLYITPIQYKLHRSTGDTVIRVMHSTDTAWYSFPVAGTIISVAVDPNDWLIDKSPTPVKDAAISGINQLKDVAEQKMFPNPASNNITISGEGSFSFSLFDISGKLLLKKSGFNSETIDISGFAEGVYLGRINDNNGSYTTKVIISR